MMSLRRVVVVATGLALLPASQVLAQSNQEINAGVQFSFAPPGARSMALGGAFLGLADDATAAYANPAGLTVLSKPEISFEGRGSRFTSLFTDGGSLEPRTPSGKGIDTVSGLTEGSIDDDVVSPSFVSLVYPKGKVAIALFRHELVNYKASILTSGAYHLQADEGYRLFPVDGALDLDIVDYGVGIGFEVSEQFSMGVGLSLFDFSLSSRTNRYAVDGPSTTAAGGFYGEPDFGASNLKNYQTQEGSGTAFAASAGLLVKPTPKVQIGVVYRKGASFEDDAVALGHFPGPKSTASPALGAASFKVPDSFGAGIALKPSDRLTLTADVLRVMHSQRLDSFESIFGDDESLEGQFAVDDGTEAHVGVEYVFAGLQRPFAVRAGAWMEPDSRIRYTGDMNSGLSVNGVLFREGESYLHGTFGLGWVLGSSFQIDFAADISSRTKIGTCSAVYRF